MFVPLPQTRTSVKRARPTALPAVGACSHADTDELVTGPYGGDVCQDGLPVGACSYNPGAALSAAEAPGQRATRSLLLTQLPSFLDQDTLKLRIEEMFTTEVPKILSETPNYTGPQSASHSGALEVHPRHLLSSVSELPFSVCSVRLAKADKSGHTPYAIVDLTSAKLMETALRFFGDTTILPGTAHHIHLAPYKTWGAPVRLDDYHVYIAGLHSETDENGVLVLLARCGVTRPRSVKIGKDTRCHYDRCLGFAFLRYDSEGEADQALKRLQVNGMVNGIMARRVYVPPHHRKVTTSCSNSIFLANIPSDVTKAELAQLFGYFGDIRSVVVHNEKRIAFLEFSTHASALAAITHMQGYVLRHHTLACSWSVRRHTTYQDEGIEEDDGYRRSEEAFAYNAAKAMEPTVGLANGAHAASELDPTLLAAGDRAVRLKNPAQGEAALELSPERHLFWLSFYAADPRVSSRTLLATMDAALESSKTSSPRPSP